MEGRTHRVVAKMRIELGMEDEAGPSNTQQQRSTPPLISKVQTHKCQQHKKIKIKIVDVFTMPSSSFQLQKLFPSNNNIEEMLTFYFINIHYNRIVK